jgi:uncharacterized membrane-anchored protein
MLTKARWVQDAEISLGWELAVNPVNNHSDWWYLRVRSTQFMEAISLMDAALTALLADAVKIGFPVLGTIFGAIVGAASTYFVSKLNHNHDAGKDVARRRCELLMQSATDITEFENRVG